MPSIPLRGTLSPWRDCLVELKQPSLTTQRQESMQKEKRKGLCYDIFEHRPENAKFPDSVFKWHGRYDHDNIADD